MSRAGIGGAGLWTVCALVVGLLGSAPQAEGLPAPPGLRARALDDGVHLRWTFRGGTSDGADLLIERAAEGGGYATAVRVARGRRRGTVVDSPAPGRWSYRARVEDVSGVSGWSAPATVAIAGAEPPGAGGDPPLPAGQRECPAGSVDGVLALVNGARRDPGIAALRTDAALMRAARMHTIAMVSARRLTHNGWVTTIRETGYGGGFLGENIAFGYQSASAVVSGWLGSAGHRANLLNGGFRDTGVGCVVDQRGRLWWTQDFGG
jgi:hypothetical protein